MRLPILVLERALEAPEAQALLDRCEGRLAPAIQAAKEGER